VAGKSPGHVRELESERLLRPLHRLVPLAGEVFCARARPRYLQLVPRLMARRRRRGTQEVVTFRQMRGLDRAVAQVKNRFASRHGESPKIRD
jgi:hypothetical protein